MSFLVTSSSGFTQSNNKIDSLESLLATKEDASKYDLMIEIVRAYAAEDHYDKSLIVALDAHKVAYHIADTNRIIQSHRILGQIYNHLNRSAEAEKILIPIIPICKRAFGCETDLALIFNNLSIVYVLQAQFDKALNFYFKALDLMEQRNDKFNVSVITGNIGIVFYKLSNYKKAIYYYKEAIKLRQGLNDDFDLDLVLINLSLCYAKTHHFNEARKCLDDALVICKGSCRSQAQLELEFALGDIEYREGNLKNAESLFLQSLKISRDIGDQRYQIENIISLSKLYLKEGEIKKAQYYLELGVGIAFEANLDEVNRNFYYQMWLLYDKMHDDQNAAKYLRKYIQIRDSTYNSELTQNIMATQIEYEQRANKARIELQTKAIALKEEVISNQNKLTIVACVAIVILGLLGFVLYRNNQQKKIANAILEERVLERTKDLQNSYQLIQKAYDDQTHFVDKIINDIKIPLSSMTESCTRGLENLQVKETQRYLTQLNNTTDQLHQIVNKLADGVVI